jgi:hypothetical protein
VQTYFLELNAIRNYAARSLARNCVIKAVNNPVSSVVLLAVGL